MKKVQAYQDIQSLATFDQIGLSEMDEVKLMNRTDTKFVFKRSDLASFLELLQPSYRVLNVQENLISSYKTLYFDTSDFKFFNDHHNGKGNRFKVRIRNYVESNLFFLEIKNKYKQRTVKHRIGTDKFYTTFDTKSKSYLNEVLGSTVALEPKLWNDFKRITLVGKYENERLTLDLGLTFDWEGKSLVYDEIVIAELKQEFADRDSVFYNLMKSKLIRPNGLSKYCIGSVGIYPALKYNNFKEKILLIDKLI